MVPGNSYLCEKTTRLVPFACSSSEKSAHKKSELHVQLLSSYQDKQNFSYTGPECDFSLLWISLSSGKKRGGFHVQSLKLEIEARGNYWW